MNKYKSAAIVILTTSKQPLHYREITRLALEKGILATEGATPEATMNAQIILDIKHNGKLSDFIKTAPSTYALNPDKPQLQINEKEDLEEEKLDVASGFIGKAGEHLVCSELLFRGFNASMMSVDTGVDIVATKENHLYGIQVKTARLNKFKYYNFDIRKVSFEKNNTGSMHNPEQGGHQFRTMAATESEACRPPIPGQSGHFLGEIGISGRHQSESEITK